MEHVLLVLHQKVMIKTQTFLFEDKFRINEVYLYSSFRFYMCDSSIHIFWNQVPAVKQTASHIFSRSWVTFYLNFILYFRKTHSDLKASNPRQTLRISNFSFKYHLVLCFKAGTCDFHDCVLFMRSFFTRNNRSIGRKRKMDSWIRDLNEIFRKAI